ncbi:MAG TPA: arylesterase, partial [Candidatus Sulfopaludibacter sp.]|nr:arylesterase [Candidatus Sulfopaludibacter sp.]
RVVTQAVALLAAVGSVWALARLVATRATREARAEARLVVVRSAAAWSVARRVVAQALALAAVAGALCAAADNRPAIVCFGDSLTAGMGLDAGQAYPEVLQRLLDRRGFRYRVVNQGVSGETSQDGLARVPMVLAEKPAVVVLEFGANDGLRGQPIANTEKNLAQMIERLQGARARVVLAGITLPPNYGRAYIQRFDAMYKSLAAKYKVEMIPFLLAGVAGNPKLMQRDGLHPNADGTRIVAGTVSQAILALLKRR